MSDPWWPSDDRSPSISSNILGWSVGCVERKTCGFFDAISPVVLGYHVYVSLCICPLLGSITFSRLYPPPTLDPVYDSCVHSDLRNKKLLECTPLTYRPFSNINCNTGDVHLFSQVNLNVFIRPSRAFNINIKTTSKNNIHENMTIYKMRLRVKTNYITYFYYIEMGLDIWFYTSICTTSEISC